MEYTRGLEGVDSIGSVNDIDSSYIKQSFSDAFLLVRDFLNNPVNLDGVNRAIKQMVDTYSKGGGIISCGNGGSFCDSIHFAEELTGRFRKNRIPLPAASISDPAHLTCVANDFGYDQVFSRYVEAWGQKNDTLLAISTSGNSPNVINAVQAAKKKRMKTIGLLGKTGGTLKDLVDHPVIVNHTSADRIQEIHIKIIHIFIEGIERHLFPDLYGCQQTFGTTRSM